MKQTFVLHAGDPHRSRIVANLVEFVTQKLTAAKSWEITIAQHRKKRTDKQRKALFGAAYKALMEFSGLEGEEDKKELHRFMCRKFFGERLDAFGRAIPLRTTTKNEQGEPDEIDVEEALRFYAFLQRQGAEVGCYVPDPDPFWREQRAAA